MNITNFEHITLIDGNCSISPPNYAMRQTTLDALLPVIRAALEHNEPTEIPGIGLPYSFCASADQTTLWVTVLKFDLVVATIAIALDPNHGQSSWSQLHNVPHADRLFATEPGHPPTRPWIAERFEMGQLMALDAMAWLEEFEQCVACTFAQMHQQTKKDLFAEQSIANSKNNAPMAQRSDDETTADNPAFEPLGIGRGRPCPITVPKGGAIRFSSGGFEVFLNLPSPDAYEVNAFRASHPLRIGVAQVGRLGFLLTDFGEGLTAELPFDVGIEAPEDRPHFGTLTPQSRIFSLIAAVDGDTNLVFGLRGVTLSPRVTSHVVKLLAHQSANPISRHEYNTLVNNAYARYPRDKDLKRIALAMDKAGS